MFLLQLTMETDHLLPGLTQGKMAILFELPGLIVLT
jgi:hypothetical protein